MTILSVLLSRQEIDTRALLGRMTPAGLVAVPVEAVTEVHGRLGISIQRPIYAAADSDVSLHYEVESGACLLFVGRLFNKDEIDATLYGPTRADWPTTARTVIDAVRKWGWPVALAKFRGQFNVVMHDAVANTLIAARDLFGTLPLYFTVTSRGFGLASLGRQLLPLHLTMPDTNDSLVWRYLTGDIPSSGIFAGVDTFFKGIGRVKSGHILTYTNGQVSQQAYHDFRVLLGPRVPGPADSAKYLMLLENVVREQAGDFAGVGSALSGGLDSTALAVLLHRASAGRPAFPTISIAVAGAEEDANIEAVLAGVNAQASWVATDDVNMFSMFEETTANHEGPSLTPSAAVFHLLKKTAREHGIDVLFSGLGADEVLGGMNLGYLADLFRAGHWMRAYRELAAYTEHDSMHYGRSKLRIFRQHVYDPTAFLPRRNRSAHWINPDFARDHLDDPQEPPFSAPEDQSIFVARTLDKLMRSFTQTFLHCEIHNAAVSGIEHRFPFLDPRIISYALRLPWDERISGGIYKIHHRKAFTGLLPDRVLRQERKSYIPRVHDRWLCETYRKQVDALVLDPSARYARYLDRKAVVREHGKYTNETDFARKTNLRRSTWRALSLELWLRAFWP